MSVWARIVAAGWIWPTPRFPATRIDEHTDAAAGSVVHELASPHSFAGRTALITGATIGPRAGVRPVAGRRGCPRLPPRRRSRRPCGGRPSGWGRRRTAWCCDATSGRSTTSRAVGDFLHRTAAPISLVIHAAGAAGDGNGMITASPVDQLDEHYLMAVRGPYVLNQQVLPQLSGGARIVFFQPVPSRTQGRSAHGAVVAAARRGRHDRGAPTRAAGTGRMSVVVPASGPRPRHRTRWSSRDGCPRCCIRAPVGAASS